LFTTKAWSAEGTFQHSWSPTWASTAFAGYVGASRSVDPTAAAQVIALENAPVSAWSVGGNLSWKPAEKFSITTEIGYGSVTNKTGPGTEITNGAFGGVFRVQRDF
jgi:hypothetical protein